MRKNFPNRGRRPLRWKFIPPLLGAAALVAILKIVHPLSVKLVQLNLQNTPCLDQPTARQLASFGGQSMLWPSTSTFETRLKTGYLCVDSVRVAKKWPATLELDIVGRTPVLKFTPAKEASVPAELSIDSQLFKELEESTDSASLSAQFAPVITTTDYLTNTLPDGSPLLSDQTGLLYSHDTGVNVPDVILIESSIDVGYRIDPVEMQSLLQTIKALDGLSLPIHSITVKESTAVVRSDNPMYLLFTLNSSISRELASLQLILRQNTIDSKVLESIDFRFDRPVLTYSSKK